jgi:energy-coupling factor transporter ATP-binding protein EcfA2
MDVFRDINSTLGVTIIIVTHDRQIARKVDIVVAIRDGRTSSEFIRKKSYAEELAELSNDIGTVGEDTHEELAVIDKVGRLQIPREYIEALGLGGKKTG